MHLCVRGGRQCLPSFPPSLHLTLFQDALSSTRLLCCPATTLLPPAPSLARWQQGKGLWTEVKTLADFDREVMHADKLVVVGECEGAGAACWEGRAWCAVVEVVVELGMGKLGRGASRRSGGRVQQKSMVCCDVVGSKALAGMKSVSVVARTCQPCLLLLAPPVLCLPLHLSHRLASPFPPPTALLPHSPCTPPLPWLASMPRLPYSPRIAPPPLHSPH